LLIWDDGSTDDSVEIAQHYVAQDKRIRVIAAPHQGRAPALKAAIAATSGTYLGWVDSDDLLAQTALADTAAILDQQPDIGMVYTDYIVIDENDQVKGYGNLCQIPYSKDKLLTEFMTFHFRLMRRNVYEQVGGIDEAFMYCQDYDICLKLSEVTDFYHLQKPLYYYRHHKNSISCEKRIEQILLGKKAIENAMQRRGMTDEYELEFQIFGRASLFRKPTTPSDHHSLSESTQPISLPLCVNPNEFTHWALAPAALVWIANLIQTHSIQTVLELGSGLSTILLAALKQQGKIQHTLSLEHDPHWHRYVIERLRQKGLQDHAQVQLCPLRQFPLNGELVKWYDPETIPPFTADLILIDGPPSQTDLLARHPAPHLLQSAIRPGTWMILDDADRPTEQAIIQRWLQEFPTLQWVEKVAIDTGLAILRFVHP
jgi:predicted O-methyltransferase YrrM